MGQVRAQTMPLTDIWNTVISYVAQIQDIHLLALWYSFGAQNIFLMHTYPDLEHIAMTLSIIYLNIKSSSCITKLEAKLSSRRPLRGSILCSLELSIIEAECPRRALRFLSLPVYYIVASWR